LQAVVLFLPQTNTPVFRAGALFLGAVQKKKKPKKRGWGGAHISGRLFRGGGE